MKHSIVSLALMMGVVGLFSSAAQADDPVATLGSVSSVNGHNFTNAIVTVAVTSYTSGDVSLVLKQGSTQVGDALSVTEAKSYVFNLPDLTVGQPCSYTVELKSGDTVLASKTQTHIAANVSTWLTSTKTTTTGGAWSPDLSWGTTTATIYDSEFTITTPSAVANKYEVIDSVVSFEGPIPMEEVTDLGLTDVQGAIALIDNDGTKAWYAYLSGSWVELSSSTDVPTTAGSYLIRAEFDYWTASPKVRYQISSDGGTTFHIMKQASNEWLANSKESVTGLNSIRYYGNMAFTSLDGTYWNKNVASINSTEYSTFEAALTAAGVNTVKLLTNVSWVPNKTGDWTIDVNGCALELLPGAEWSARLNGTQLAVRNGYLFDLVNGLGVKTSYCTLADAFEAIADNASKIVLKDDVYDTLSAALSEDANNYPATLDLAGSDFIGGQVTIANGRVLTITNSTAAAGLVNFASIDAKTSLSDQFKITGGKWTAAAKSAYASCLLSDKYKFIDLAGTETSHDLTFTCEAKYFEGEAPSADSKVYPVSISGGAAVSVVVPDKFIEDNIPGASGMTAQQKATALSADRPRGESSNGLTLLESHVLGLDPNDKNSVPVAVAKQSTDPAKIVFSLGGLTVNSKAGCDVTFVVEEADPDGSYGPLSGASQTGSHEFTISKPNTVKYYKIKARLGK